MKLRLLSILLAAVVAGGVMLAGCKKVESDTPSSSETQSSDVSSDGVEGAEGADGSNDAESTEDPDDTSSVVHEEEIKVYPPITSDGALKKYDSIVTIGDAGYELYTYVPKKAEIYTGLINDAAKQLAGTANVYNMVIPISAGITLPDNYKDQVNNSDMKESLALLSEQFSSDVQSIELYDALMTHRDAYIYFRTDHHWTARGAYYAYAEFCKAKGITPHELSEYRPREFDGFLGTFYKDTGKSADLGDHPDTVEVFYPVGENIKLNFTDTKGNSYDWPIISNVTNSPAELKYSTFAGADNPYTVIENPDVTDGSTLVVVKESFGNALIPFLADHYQTIYELDYRYWNGNVVSFAKEKGADDVLFANNISMTRSDYLIGKLSQVLS